MAFTCSSVIAALLTLNYSGSVTVVGPDLGGAFSLGDQVAGSLTYDPALAGSDSLVANPNYGQYSGAVTDFNLTIGSYSATFVSSIL